MITVTAFLGSGTLGQQSPPASERPSEEALRLAIANLAKPGDSYSSEVAAMVESFPAYENHEPVLTEDILIDCSDTTAVLMMEAGRAWTKIHPQSDVAVKPRVLEGELASLTRTPNALLAIPRSVTPDELARFQANGGTLHEVPIARDAVAIFVHVDNPIAGLTRRQCNGIFSSSHSMISELILDWRDLDPTSPLGEQKFPLYMLDSRSATMKRITEWCMPGETITTIDTFVEHTGSSVVNACCAYRTAMGVASTSLQQPRARMVPLSSEDNGPFVAPTTRTIADGSYPLCRPINLVFVTPKGVAVPEHIRQFLRFLWSQDGQAIVARLQMVPPDVTKIPTQLGAPVAGVWK